MYKSVRGGVPTTTKITEFDAALKTEDLEPLFIVEVSEHKRRDDGACPLVIEEREIAAGTES